MGPSSVKVKAILAGVLLCLAGWLLYACGGVPAPRMQFAQRECLDCHKKFASDYLGMKSIHPTVKERKCESCHLRHGLVPKLLLKRDGNQVCLECHSREKMGLNRKHVHTALKRDKCTSCHNPHASQADHLLKAEGNEICYACHKRETFQKKVVHKALETKACTACHAAHSSSEAALLVKPEVSLCLGCHDQARPQFRKAHSEYPVGKAASCLSCHNPHSAAQAKLLKTSAHSPVATGQCEMCHKPP